MVMAVSSGSGRSEGYDHGQRKIVTKQLMTVESADLVFVGHVRKTLASFLLVGDPAAALAAWWQHGQIQTTFPRCVWLAA